MVVRIKKLGLQQSQLDGGIEWIWTYHIGSGIEEWDLIAGCQNVISNHCMTYEFKIFAIYMGLRGKCPSAMVVALDSDS